MRVIVGPPPHNAKPEWLRNQLAMAFKRFNTVEVDAGEYVIDATITLKRDETLIFRNGVSLKVMT